MTYLLDTHILWWAHMQPGQLGRKAAALLADEANRFAISCASAFELACLVQRGRLRIGIPLHRWLDQVCSHFRVQEIPIQREIALEACELPGDFHRDPVDRLITATSRLRGLPLITADALILGYAHVQTLNGKK